ncbi:MAG: tRNA (guanosine(37)-N1)-methyltransferase TrmD [Prochlorococcus marinus CUG1430]|uniref:tRNA (guanosine(37)-N1)-methyltransferase TrmD n=1 Tax=Prochlorococcus marinus TaxID=1219 RepID=UPI001FD66AD0|nr:tRNA (guanosine(37)-N1)-methyltransferase TrmD [Prochlorococcus marinus]MCR8537099.1 tRNA (guanosine(37)-N1)-methyltransferase TrmD [Prochlorococcus marinus CUG1430]
MSSFNFDVITLFPKAFELINNLGVITRALDKNLIDLNLYDLRDYGVGSYRQVDDKPYGGGAGMVLKPEPIYKAHHSINKSLKSKTLLMTPQGKVLKQQDLVRWSSLDQLIIICGQYEGFDERVRCLADEEISLGDFVLSGGEIPALSIINGLTRLLPGTLGDPESLVNESHNLSILEYPQYTRPEIFKEMKVPNILLSGNHQEIRSWRKNQMIIRTKKRRKDLLDNKSLKNFSEISKVENDKKKLLDSDEYINYPNW